jgi:UDP-hydrolysing UDP-N-acetyl-D-glucosamine 2-epimerase
MARVTRISVVTTSRADYGIYRPLLRLLATDSRFDLAVIAAGAHFLREHGYSVRAIEQDGFPIGARIEFLLASDTAEATALTVGLAVQGFARAYARLAPDFIVVLGDRFEMHAAAVAASPFPIALAHIHGGELSFGAIDDAWRHSTTKLAHLHFVSTPEYARRVAQLGEEDWRIHTVGALGLDNVDGVAPLPPAVIAERLGIALEPDPVIVTYHPTTRGHAADDGAAALLSALETIDRPIVITAPNADPGNRALRDAYAAFAARRPRTALVDTLGSEGYFGLMRCAAAMVGNSSSGLIEAPSFGLPVVNIGERQDGRVRGANVIDCPNNAGAIAVAVAKALDPAFRRKVSAIPNPYWDSGAAPQIIGALAAAPRGRALLVKRFVDRP